jgi:hypothetical protein
VVSKCESGHLEYKRLIQIHCKGLFNHFLQILITEINFFLKSGSLECVNNRKKIVDTNSINQTKVWNALDAQVICTKCA